MTFETTDFKTTTRPRPGPIENLDRKCFRVMQSKAMHCRVVFFLQMYPDWSYFLSTRHLEECNPNPNPNPSFLVGKKEISFVAENTHDILISFYAPNNPDVQKNNSNKQNQFTTHTKSRDIRPFW